MIRVPTRGFLPSTAGYGNEVARNQRRARAMSAAELPLELWANIFTHLQSPNDIAATAAVCKAWSAELSSSASDALWRQIWDHQATLPSHLLLAERPWARVEGGWRAQVAASYRLATQTGPRTLFVPSRYTRAGDIHPEDVLNVFPTKIDVEDVLGRAKCVQAFGTAVLIGFEKGLGLVRLQCRSGSSSVSLGKATARLLARRNIARAIAARSSPDPCDVKPSVKQPSFYFDETPLLGGFVMFAPKPVGSDGLVLAATSTHLLVLIDCRLSKHNLRRPIQWRILDSYASHAADGNLVELAVSDNEKHAFVCFDNGHVRVVDVKMGGLAHCLSMRESADQIACDSKFIVAANFYNPIGCVVWDIIDGRALHRFDQTSVGWEEITSLAGVTSTHVPGHFALWNGKDAVRILNAKTGRFTRIIEARSRFVKDPGRSATEEAEHGAACAHIGRGKMALFADKRTAVLATSNRVLVVPLDAPRTSCRTKRPQLDNARRAQVALSMDDRVIITAECDAFGSLGSRVAGRAALAASPRLRVWNVATGVMRCEIPVPSPVTNLSVAGSTIAAIAGAVGQAIIRFHE